MRTNLTLGALVLSLAVLSACRQDMHDQPKYIPLRPSDFFADGRSARPIIGAKQQKPTSRRIPTADVRGTVIG